MFDQWMVVVSGSKMVEDIRKRPDEEVSFIEGAEEGLKTEHTIGRQWVDDPYPVDIIREKLMRTLPVVLPDVLDELTLAVPDHIPTVADGALTPVEAFYLVVLTLISEWTIVHVFPTMQRIVARASNRVFVGAPACTTSR